MDDFLRETTERQELMKRLFALVVWFREQGSDWAADALLTTIRGGEKNGEGSLSRGTGDDSCPEGRPA